MQVVQLELQKHPLLHKIDNYRTSLFQSKRK